MFTTRNVKRNILSFRLCKSCKRFFASLPKVARSDGIISVSYTHLWWSDTFLLSNTFAISGVKSAPAIKGSFSQSSAIMSAAVPPMSSVRKLLSVLG